MSALIAYRNLVDLPGVTLSPYGTTTVATGYPLDNLQTRQLARTTRLSSFGGDPVIEIDLGASYLVDVVALLGINATAAGANDLTIEWSANGSTWNSATAPTPADAGAPDLPRNVIVRTRATGGLTKITTRYLRITLRWTTAGPYCEIGRLYIADAIDFPMGCDSEWVLGCRDYGELDRSAGLQYYADRRARGRVLSLGFTGIPTKTAYGFADDASSASNVPSIDDFINFAGTTGDIIVAPRADSPLWMRRVGIYGHLESPAELRHTAGPYHSLSMSVFEER